MLSRLIIYFTTLKVAISLKKGSTTPGRSLRQHSTRAKSQMSQAQLATKEPFGSDPFHGQLCLIDSKLPSSLCHFLLSPNTVDTRSCRKSISLPAAHWLLKNVNHFRLKRKWRPFIDPLMKAMCTKSVDCTDFLSQPENSCYHVGTFGDGSPNPIPTVSFQNSVMTWSHNIIQSDQNPVFRYIYIQIYIYSIKSSLYPHYTSILVSHILKIWCLSHHMCWFAIVR